MTKEDFIKQYKKEGLVLIQHTEKVELDGTPFLQYVPQGTLDAMIEHGWFIVASVSTPPEALEIFTTKAIEENETVIETKPTKRGRKSNKK